MLKKLNFGNPFVSFPHFSNSVELLQPQGEEQLLAGDEIVHTPWNLEDNSVCSAKIFFKLDSLIDDRQFFSVMKELYRVCVDGALIEIRSNAQATLDRMGMRGRVMSTARLGLLDAQNREALRSDPRFATLVPAPEAFDFHFISERLSLSDALQKALSEQSFNSKEELRAFLDAHEEGLLFKTFYLNVRKVKDNVFAMVEMPGIEPYALRMPVPQTEEQRLQLEAGSWSVSKNFSMRTLISGMSHYHEEYKQGFPAAHIGAQNGRYTLLSTAFSSLVTIDAFEGDKATAEMLQQNIGLTQLDERVKVFPYAVSNVDEKRTEDRDGVATEVEYKTLDSVYRDVESAKWPELIIIDLEGKKQQVFEGAQQMFERGYRPLILCTLDPKEFDPEQRQDFYKTLIEKYEYSVYCIRENKERTAANLKISNLQFLDELQDAAKTPDSEMPAADLIFVPQWMDIEHIRPKA